MVAVVIDQGELAIALRGGQITVALEAPAHAAELGQRCHDGLVRQLQLGRHRDGGQRVQDVVHAGQIQRHGQIRQGLTPAELALHCEAHLAAGQCLHIHRAHLVAFCKTIADHRAREQRHDGAHTRIVTAQNRRAIERHAVQKLHKRRLQLGEVVAIGFHMVGVDIGDDGQHGQEVQEGGVGLIRLHDDVLARAQARIGTCAHQLAADHKGRVHTGFAQNRRDQRGRGGLAMRAGNRNALLQAHQLSQHDGALHHRNLLGAGRDDFGVVGPDRRRGDQHLSARDVRGRMADMDLQAQAGQALRGGAIALVGARDGVAQVVQDLGDAAHAGAADADKMDVLNGVLHVWLTRASISSATRLAARGRAS